MNVVVLVEVEVEVQLVNTVVAALLELLEVVEEVVDDFVLLVEEVEVVVVDDFVLLVEDEVELLLMADDEEEVIELDELEPGAVRTMYAPTPAIAITTITITAIARGAIPLLL